MTKKHELRIKTHAILGAICGIRSVTAVTESVTDETDGARGQAPRAELQDVAQALGRALLCPAHPCGPVRDLLQPQPSVHLREFHLLHG